MTPVNATHFGFSPDELHFLLHAAGGECLSLTRPGATGLTGEGVLALRARLKALVDAPAGGVVIIAHLTPDQQADIRSHVGGISDGAPATYPTPRRGWQCFHCGETFRTVEGAALHFGDTPVRPAACIAEAVGAVAAAPLYPWMTDAERGRATAKHAVTA